MTGEASKRSAEGIEASAGLSASERIEGLIAGLADWRGERLAEILGFIHEAEPDVVEEWKWMVSPVFKATKNLSGLILHCDVRLPDLRSAVGHPTNRRSHR